MSSCVSDENRKTAVKKYSECNEVTSPGGWIGEISSLNSFFLALCGVALEKDDGNGKFSGEICTLHSSDMVFDLYVNVQWEMETHLPSYL